MFHVKGFGAIDAGKYSSPDTPDGFERSRIARKTGLLSCLTARAHTGEGRARAVANGVRLGRNPTLTHHQQLEAIKRLNAGKETQDEIARSYNVSRWTIARLAP
jgi:hypothetical protein